MKAALLPIAHGSRNAEANADLHHLAEQLRRRGTYALVEPLFLELADSDIETAGGNCVAQGAGRVILLPYFLAAGIHARQDMQAYRDRLAARFPQVQLLLAETLGPHESLLELAALRARQGEGN